MSARTIGPAKTGIGFFVGLFIYLLIGCAIYLLAYGEPQGFGLSLVVVAWFWPFALVWWSLYWIGIVIALGAKHIWEGL